MARPWRARGESRCGHRGGGPFEFGVAVTSHSLVHDVRFYGSTLLVLFLLALCELGLFSPSPGRAQLV